MTPFVAAIGLIGLVAWLDERVSHARAILLTSTGVSISLMLGALLLALREIRLRAGAQSRAEIVAAEVHDLYNRAPCGYHSIDASGMVLAMNDTELSWLGYTREEVVGKMRISDLLSEAGKAMFQEGFPKFLADDETRTLDISLRKKDGTFLPLLMSATAVRNEHGELVRTRTTVFDLTDRKRAERALAEMKFAIDETASVATADAHGRITYVNDRFCRTSGYSREELVGKDHRVLNSGHHPRAFFTDLWQTIQGGRVWRGEVCDRTKDGELYWVSNTIVPVAGPDGKPTQYISLRFDLTERKLAEQALKASEEELRRAKEAMRVLNEGLELQVADRTRELVESERFARASLDALPTHLVVIDDRGTILSTNATWDAFAAENGGQPEAVGVGVNYLKVCHRSVGANAEGARQVADGIWAVIRGRRESFGIQYTCHSPTEERWFVCRARRFPGGGPVRVIVAHQDISSGQRVNRSLASAEARIVSLLTRSPVILYALRVRDGVITPEWTAPTIARLGYDPSHTLQDDWWSQRIHPLDAARVQAAWDSLPAGGHLDVEYRFRHARGHYVWLRDTWVFLADGESGNGEIIGSCLEITDRKRSELAIEALHRVTGKEERDFCATTVAELANLLGAEFAFINRLVGPTEVTIIAGTHAGRPMPPMTYGLGGTPCENVHKGKLCIHPAGVAAAFPHDPFLTDNRIEAYAGVLLRDSAKVALGMIVVLGVQPFEDAVQVERTLELFAVRVSAELERQHAEKRFQDLFEFAPDAIVMTTEAGAITLVNRQAEALFGYKRAEIIGEQVARLLPNAVGETGGFVTPAQPGSERPVLRALRKDGTSLPVDITLAPMASSEGKVVAAAVRDVTERTEAEDSTRQSLREKEVLLREIHHRVKNNLQVVSSLLAMQAETTSDARSQDVLRESIHRVRSMSLIHERLYQSDTLSVIDFGEYARALAGFLVRSYSVAGPVRLVVEADSVTLNIETAVPCGLVLNELVSNALKHAFTGPDGGTLTIGVRRGEHGTCTLSVQDTGPGIPPGLDLQHTTSLGLQLITALTQQIKGTLTVENRCGACFHITFRELTYAPR